MPTLKMVNYRADIKKFTEDIVDIEAAKKQYISDFVDNCEHKLEWLRQESLRSRTKYTGSMFNRFDNRICLVCGYKEYDKGCGFKTLGRDVYGEIEDATEEELKSSTQSNYQD